MMKMKKSVYDYLHKDKEKLKYLDKIKLVILKEKDDIKDELFSDGYANRIIYNQKRCILDALLQWVY